MNPATLATAKSWEDADLSHQSLVRFYAAKNDRRARNISFVTGEHYTPEELQFYKDVKRVPVVMNQFPSSRRTVVGTFLRERFETEFVPVDSDDQELADTLRALASHESDHCDDVPKDAVMAVHAWLGADSNLLCWPEIQPGESPHDETRVLNPYAVSWDANSTDYINRTDAQLVDIDLWMSSTEMLDKWPNAKFKEDVIKGSGNSDLTPVDKSRDRDHETKHFRNGLWHVVERYYRYQTKMPCALDANDEWQVIKDVEKFKQFFPNVNIINRKTEMLYVCQWAPEAQDGKEFLYNGPYNVQPRDPYTRKILWPVVELIAEQVGSTPRDFVTDLVDANKVIDVMTTGIIEQAKHAGASYEQDDSAYIDDKEANRAAKYGSQPNQTFKMKPGMAGKGRVPVASKESTNDFTKGINIAGQHFNQQSSTPPAMQGISEGSVAASLNMQRIEQGNTQLTEFINNYRTYRRALLKLRYAYWRETLTDYMIFRIKGDDGKNKVYELNKQVPAKDKFGNIIPNKIQTVNDINSALYDVRMVDSFKSPTVRDRQLQVLGQLMQNQVVMQDPRTAGALTKEFLRLTDSSHELKEEIRNATVEAADARNTANELQNIQSMQQIATSEASAVAPNGIPQGIREVPARQPQIPAEPSNQELESVQ